MKTIDVEISKIKTLENIRLRVGEKDVHTLMASIKQDGLLQPVGLSKTTGKNDEYIPVFGNRRIMACMKLGWKTIPAILQPSNMPLKEFMVKNITENVIREPISESELGRSFYMLTNNFDMTESEIASRLSMSKGRVTRAMNIFHNIPEKYRDKIKYNIIGPKKGMIPASTANSILGIRRRYALNAKDISTLLEAARKDGFTADHVEVIAALISRDYSIDDSIKIASNYTIISAKVPLLKSEIKEKKKKYGKPLVRIISEIISGELDETFDVPIWQDEIK